MRRITLILLLVASALLSACAGMTAATPDTAALQQAVAHTERAFAKSMADRDHAALASFLSEEAVFFSGAKVLRGKATVAQAWKRFYESPTAPFSWQPEQVEVLPSGTLALSSGPVHDAQGKLIGTFTSIWRLEEAGVWRIVFDKGNEVCDCRTP